MIQQINTCSAEIDIIRNGTAIAAENARQHVGALHQKNEEAQRWANDVIQDQSRLIVDCDGLLEKLDSIQIHDSLARLFVGAETTPKGTRLSERQSNLSSLVNLEQVNAARRRSKAALDGLRTRVEDLQASYEDIVHDGNSISDEIEARFSSTSEETSQNIGDLAEELEGIVKQISADYENTLTLPNNSRTVATVSKTALLHTRKFLPSLSEIAIDIGDMCRKVVERRNSVEEIALNFMQRIASVESNLASVQSLIRGIDLSAEEGEALDILSRVTQVPIVYASLLVEIVRRQEWTQKMMTDSSTLAEEMAVYKDDEERKRKKWLKNVGDLLHPDALSSKAKGIEVNIQGQDESSPALTRNDISQFVGDLERAKGFEDLLQEVSEWIKSLDVPSKPQAKRSNAFRKGTITDSMFGKNSLLLRGDDDLESLQTEKSKLEDRLKTSESRVRKLEDLLHRSTQMNRPFPGSVPVPGLQINQPSPALERKPSLQGANYATSPKGVDLDSRRSSLASHRTSLIDGHHETQIAQRIVQLETDLASERKKTTKFEEAALRQVTEHDELKTQMQEATTMKKDLMDNFEAQQHEFDGERRLLNDENRKLKLRLEEMEEEYDRILGSHDNARAVFDERSRTYEADLEKIRSEASENARKAEDEIGNLQAIKDNQSDRLEMLESDLAQKIAELSRFDSEVIELNNAIQQRDEAQLEQQRALIAAHSALDPDAACSNEYETLVQDLEILSQRAADHQREIRVALENVQSDNEALDCRMKDQDEEISELRVRLAETENNLFTTREDVAATKARYAALNEELAVERKSLADLRTQVTSSESGSENLRSLLTQEEQKAQTLRTELASIKATSGDFDIELAKRLEKIESLQISHDSAHTRLHDRARRAGEVSLQLFLQIDRLNRLLEHIGYSVSRQNDAMVVQRIPRSASANNANAEQSQIMNRDLPGSVPSLGNKETPEYLHWAMADDPRQEDLHFETFMHESKAFDMDAFSDAVAKRVKDTEHIARKWQREAKSYRDKFRSAQFEAQHKIAFRSFKEGDLALFLPTRNQAPQRSWAAFNVGAPHYFLREQEFHHLNSRDWLLARIAKVEDRVVDLSKGVDNRAATLASDDGASFDDDNPFGLSDGLRWYYLDATEENLGAPIAPGPARTTVASAHVDAEGSIQRKKNLDQSAATRTLTRSLDSRRSSANSKKSVTGAVGSPALATGTFDSVGASATSTAHSAEPAIAPSATGDDSKSLHPKPMPMPTPGVIPEEVRKDQLFDP